MKIVWFHKRPLLPCDTGCRIRSLHLVRYLARYHHVTCVCNFQHHEAWALDEMARLGVRVIGIPWREAGKGSPSFYFHYARKVASALPYTAAKDYDHRFRRIGSRLLEQGAADLLICDYVHMARNLHGLMAPKLLFTHNVEAELLWRCATQVRSLMLRWLLRNEARKMYRFEARVGWEFDAVVAVSSRDREMLEWLYGWPHVFAIDTSVDTQYFEPMGQCESDSSVVFIGTLDWLPNVDGILYFVKVIWPVVRSSVPRVKLHVVGRNPVRAVRRLAAMEGIRVHGSVPDVRPFLAQAAVVVVPLRMGSGTRLKIYEAMAMGKAVVSTPIGAEGLPLVPGQHIEIAGCPEEFARKVVQLLGDPARRRQLGSEARAYVTQKFSVEAVGKQFEQICGWCVDRGKRSGHSGGSWKKNGPLFRSRMYECDSGDASPPTLLGRRANATAS